MDANDSQNGDDLLGAEAAQGVEGDHRRRWAPEASEGGPERRRKALAKRIGQLHRSYAESHQITAQRELDENKARTGQILAEKQSAVTWPQRGIQSTAEVRAATQDSPGHGAPAATPGQGKGQELKIKVHSSLQGILSAPATKISYHERVPPYKSWSYLMANELATEVGARIFYTDATGETIPASDSEDEEGRRGEGSLEGAHRESEEWVMRQLTHEMGVTPEVVEALAKRLDASTAVVEARLHAVLAEHDEDAQMGAVSSMKAGVEKCAKNFCRRCRIYNCLTHVSGGDVRPHHRLPACQPTAETPCGPDCWRLKQCASQPPAAGASLSQDADSQQHPQPGLQLAQGALERTGHAARSGREVEDVNCWSGPGSDWAAFELDALQYGRKIFMGDACRIARLLGSRKCSEVHAVLRGLPASPASAPCSPPIGPARRMGSKRKPAAPPTRRKNSMQVVNKRAKHDMTKPWPLYTPCTCVGPCNAECSCAKSKNFCEKFCACGPACTIRFVGCDCKSGCRTKACPCYASGHECDPDACTACTAGCACNNMRLRFRQHKRVSMGKSAIAGWGSFLLDGARKGELVGEYTGELVTQAEADRRGKAYDRDDNSYLFNLNEEWVIDARRRGNKLRFANHSTDPNCAAKILMVDGDHRVGIFASKDIAPGTELFYDYCYTKDQAPIWAQAK